MSTLYVDSIQPKTTGSIINAKGMVIQVVSIVKSDTFSTANQSFTDIPNLTASITPTSTNSKILIMSTINGSQNVGANRSNLRLLRGSEAIFVGDTASNRLQGTAGFSSAHADLINTVHTSFVDSPSSTAEVTYKWQCIVNAGSGSVYINRSVNDNDATNQLRWASNITLMEIGG